MVNTAARLTVEGARRGASARSMLAQAAMAAIDPLVELLLEIGITSPEAESLLRSLIVHKARSWLAERGGGRVPSDVRVALVTGIHRNFVRQILLEAPKIAGGRERRGYLAGRLLRAWHTDPLYRDDSGKSRDLPEKGPPPSFASLVAASLPGSSPGVVLQELLRAGVVESLSDHRVRVRSRTMRQPGITLANVTAYGLQAKALLRTLTRKLCDPNSSAYCDSTPILQVDATRAAVIREALRRRADSFLSGLEQELSVEARRGKRRRAKLQVAVSVVETAGPAKDRGRRRLENAR